MVDFFLLFDGNSSIDGKVLFFLSIGMIFSPKWVAKEMDGLIKNGTSMPIFLANCISFFCEIGSWKSLFNAISVVAALLEPPPSPEANGIRL